MKNITAIIICAGEGGRWDNYLGVSKHFAPVDDEPILHRMVRLLNEYDITPWVVGNTNEYLVKGSILYLPTLNPDNEDADKFLSSQDLWDDEEGRTIVFYGDVFFTEEAMARIVNFEGKDWVMFGRSKASEITRCPYPECFALSFYAEHIPEQLDAFKRAIEHYFVAKLEKPGGWGLYQQMRSKRVDNFQDRFENIDDFTEDFDFPVDYDEFIIRWDKAKEQKND